MNILVFSDTHLFLPFDEKKFNFLKKIISESDQVIINGDFFDDYMITFDNFISSLWNQLFPLLKSKKTIYIFGNHDQQKFSDKRLSLFSDIQVTSYKLQVANIQYIFTHGHATRPTPDTKFNLSWKIKHFGMIFVHFFRNLLMRIFRKKALDIMYGHYNKKSKKFIKNTCQQKINEIYVIGHNHYGEIDLKNNFVCSGAIIYGFAQYLSIDSETGKIALHEEWYDR